MLDSTLRESPRLPLWGVDAITAVRIDGKSSIRLMGPADFSDAPDRRGPP
jgi:hypothetical protein